MAEGLQETQEKNITTEYLEKLLSNGGISEALRCKALFLDALRQTGGKVKLLAQSPVSDSVILYEGTVREVRMSPRKNGRILCVCLEENPNELIPIHSLREIEQIRSKTRSKKDIMDAAERTRNDAPRSLDWRSLKERKDLIHFLMSKLIKKRASYTNQEQQRGLKKGEKRDSTRMDPIIAKLALFQELVNDPEDIALLRLVIRWIQEGKSVKKIEALMRGNGKLDPRHQPIGQISQQELAGMLIVGGSSINTIMKDIAAGVEDSLEEILPEETLPQ